MALSEEKLQEHISRYFRAMYGKTYVYYVEGFRVLGYLERWMLYVSGGHEEMAEKEIKNIEDWMASQRIEVQAKLHKSIKEKSVTWGPWGEEGRQGN